MELNESEIWDAVIIGAGAAGLFCAAQAGMRGKRIMVVDHAPRLGEKIRISGGGFCNFTNRDSQATNFLSLNPHFVKGPLARYRPQDFEQWLVDEGIPFHEKHKGQLFCDHSSKDIISLLLKHCAKGAVSLNYPVEVQDCAWQSSYWLLKTSQGNITARSLVMATGGLPVPKIGASAMALNFARQWGHVIVPVRPALVPLSLTHEEADLFKELSGLSVPVRISAGRRGEHYGAAMFAEDILFTHRGLSGPATLQASSYWLDGEGLNVSFLEEPQWHKLFLEAAGRLVENGLALFLPLRLASQLSLVAGLLGRRLAELNREEKARLKSVLMDYVFYPGGTLGWNKAEVMVGGVDTRELDSRTMASNLIPQCYFIGECVDVTGHLGGHNFQWAWSSAYVCAQSL